MVSNVDFEERDYGQNGVQLTVSALPAINCAMQQNGIRTIRSVTLENHSGVDLEHVELVICASPDFAMPFTRHIDRLPAGKPVVLPSPQLKLRGEYLAGMTEKVEGLLRVTVRQGENVLAETEHPVSVLAFDQWHGLQVYPELLAAFVTPNHPELAGILSRATEFLGHWTGDPSLDGYQSQDPNRILSQAAAIFAAIRELGIAYAVPPASFEQEGQRVRLCDMVLGQKLATCLDLTVLYAACLEAVGLHPLLIATPGHLLAGLWLEDRMFPECVQDDATLITKRLAAGVHEMAVVECTCMTAGREDSFDDARGSAEKHISSHRVDAIIDVRRARLSGISPLPQRVHTAAGWTLSSNAPAPAQTQSAPQQVEKSVWEESGVKEETLPKKIQWERKLLDLGLRNTLINLRLTKTQLPILTDSLEQLENALADGSDFTVLPRPADLTLGEFSFENLQQLSAAGIIRAEFENKRIRSVLTETELIKTIKGLYRTARTALEENGANTLYLALGMLRWYENSRSTRPRYAPIILIPIELVRKSAAQGYVIRLRDDEPQMNITLLEKLKQDFGIVVSGVDPLPGDEHGIDIRRVLTIVRKAVMEQKKWDVVEAASIGIFSFSQFVMWNDIRSRTEDLMRNKVVRSLMEGKLTWQAKPLQIGQRVKEDGVLLPMSADASQLYAIQTACGGESFVLHGPPGTGKSQTITSLIANALAKGKRVLFVAEKMAALEVVQKRLDSIGIGAFCLELHSNKSKKRAVLDQLRQATEITKTVSAEDYAAKAEQLSKLRRELDGYARQMHDVQPCGSSLYDLINEYELFKDAADLMPFEAAYLAELTRGDLDRQRLVMERLTAAGREIGHPHRHCLQRIGCAEYSQNLRMSLEPTVQAYLERLEEIAPHAETIAAALGEESCDGVEQLNRLVEIAGNLLCWYDLPAAWAKAESYSWYFGEVTRMAGHFEKAGQLSEKLQGQFRPDFLKENGQQLLSDYTQNAAKWFLPRAMGLNKLTKLVNAYALAPVDKEKLQAHLTDLRDYQQELAEGQNLLKRYGEELGNLYQGDCTNWSQVASHAQRALSSATALEKLCGEEAKALKGAKELREPIQQLLDGLDGFNRAKEAFDTLLSIRERREEKWLDGQRVLCRDILEHQDMLKSWTAYVANRREAEQLGLSNVVRGYESGMDHDGLYPAWKKSLLYGLICLGIDESENLNRFSGPVFNKKIEQYKRMDKEWSHISRQEVFCRLAAKVPNFTAEAAQSSELGILQRCIKSGGRGTSIRRLFDQIPNLLPRLCPCMLMSPISAAQYLDPGRELFDIVVFDEASQLPTCKAVGVLARGTNAVIVGDPKQMPPTSFFATNTVDEENLDSEDLESILDDCLALNMPQTHLLWHYRSRHESLIAFSNSHFYENKLLTFPSVNDRESKVRFVPVEGVFDRGKTRRNRQEALAVVEELRSRCHDPEKSRQSVGVVTFNVNQQELIEDLLNEACTQDPALEAWAFGSEEPVFIKNLENVQGDERDVILFSIGYGPDETGKVSMNFGPLNRDGGWRRLNVAVSRARHEMVVFSTLRPDQIDLNRTKAEGVAALRSFLEYAQGRPIAMDAGETGGAGEEGMGVAHAICKALEDRGYETDLSVGRSSYRLDIGVVNPRQKDQYILGILLDGRSYGNARTTRDRELSQISVLEGLGWNILRVWCMDWWDNPEKTMSRILKTLRELESGMQTEKPQEEPAVQPESKVLAAAAPVKKKTPPVYRAAALPVLTLEAEDFTDPKFVREVRKRIDQVIRTEAPVSESMLVRRVVQSCGISRAGSRIQTHMRKILEGMTVKVTEQAEQRFYWHKNQEPDAYTLFRVTGEEENRRDIKDVPVQEVANAICTVLHEQVSMRQEDLLRETAKKLGYTRMGGNLLEAVEDGIRHAVSRGSLAMGSGGTYILTDGGSARAEAVLESFTR